jgi:hypothetical protein
MGDINDELCRQRNSEIANDNHYRLKWLLAAAREFIAKLDEKLADARGEGLAQEEILESVSRDADNLRRELER